MLNYKAPIDGIQSSIDGANQEQMNTFFWLKKAIIEARKEQYFMPLSSTVGLPKHFGKTIKIHEYVPLLDDRNVNDQGIDAAGATIVNGNLYGSSKDIGKITAALPTLTENGGRVNRVGWKRLVREGNITKFGFFTEFSQEALDFDSDDQLKDHISRELMNGAVQLTEAVLQADLLAGAGVELFAGAATDDDEVTGEGATLSVVKYEDLMRLDAIMTANRTPKHTKVITGSRLTDTKVVPACRVLYVGAEVTPILRAMKDLHTNPAFIPVQHYADAANVLNGEIGSVGHFRVIEVPEMLHWAGAGDTATVAGAGYRSSIGKFNVYPMLVVGDESFVTIGFQTNGKSVNFNVITKMPGQATADRNDPYGETGFSSIKWYYGTLIKRPERLAVIKTVAPV